MIHASTLDRWEAMVEAPYSRDSKVQYDLVCKAICTEFKDYRSSLVTHSKKANLQKNIRLVIERTREHIAIDEARAALDAKNLAQKEKNLALSRERHTLAESIFPQKEQYIAGHERVEDGIRNWECLISSIESGHITAKELPDYGMDYDL